MLLAKINCKAYFTKIRIRRGFNSLLVFYESILPSIDNFLCNKQTCYLILAWFQIDFKELLKKKKEKRDFFYISFHFTTAVLFCFVLYVAQEKKKRAKETDFLSLHLLLFLSSSYLLITVANESATCAVMLYNPPIEEDGTYMHSRYRKI